MSAHLQDPVDIASQKGEKCAPIPLPMQYPANLIYAQNMLAISLTQLQSLELNIAQLSFLQREHEIRATCTSGPVMIAAPRSSPAATTSWWVSTSQPATQPDAPVPAQSAYPTTDGQAAAGAPVAQERVAEAAPADGGRAQEFAAAVAAAVGDIAGGEFAEMQPADVERFRVHRRRLAAAAKMALVMILMEVRTGWFFVYFFAVFLYIGGIFDPFIDWFQRNTAQTSLEQQLNALRGRQAEAEQQELNRQQQPQQQQQQPQQQNQARSDAGMQQPHAAQTALQAAQAQAQFVQEQTKKLQEQVEQAERAAGITPSSSSGSGSGSGTSSSEGSTVEGNNAEGENEQANAPPVDPEADRPPWAHRFVYQLGVMFFMTLLPGWNPDPRYL
eukprot:gnl/TRDRNA2_/TRDRNA2_42897_c0_seq1.p1 gnl/TRDRNA2_/TRDRNA2_42897_c0~~gnl/TRDRNA2_/TRDRNA2_42897_c0_seq1.p1  ORF type:complete len:413 (+),score=97.98 gnl/TRDRNA2_/TRDRNA2_42897_c0_seq1:79-1239(+)